MSQRPEVPGGPPGGGPVEYTDYSRIRVSAMAVTSLVLGVLVCIPGITGLGAIGFGIGGVRATRNPLVRGRGVAIAGLILGILNVGGWGVAAVGWWEASGPMRGAARQFVVDVSAPHAAAAYADSGNPLSEDQVKKIIDWFGKRGAVSSIRVTGADIQYNNGFESGTVSCKIYFADGSTATGDLGLVQLDGLWRVIRAQFL
jgi:hypothetical protein